MDTRRGLELKSFPTPPNHHAPSNINTVQERGTFESCDLATPKTTHNLQWSPVMEARLLSKATDPHGDDGFGADASPNTLQRRARNGQVDQEDLRVDATLHVGWMGRRDGHEREQLAHSAQQVEGEQSHLQREAADANSKEREGASAAVPRARGMRASPSAPSLISLHPSGNSWRRDEASVTPSYLRKRQTWPGPGALWDAVVKKLPKSRAAATIEPAPHLPLPKTTAG